jgi:hypothetical protein
MTARQQRVLLIWGAGVIPFLLTLFFHRHDPNWLAVSVLIVGLALHMIGREKSRRR